jgi:hypothetical protein
MLRGDIRDFNRSTAEAAIEFAESQVFGPERDEFDFAINRKILTSFGIRFWRFKSNAPATRNAKDLSVMIGTLTDAGVLTPGEARDLSQMVFNRELKKLTAPWTTQPISLTQAGLQPPLDLESTPGAAAGLPGAQGSAAAPGADAPPLGAAGAPAGALAPAASDQPAGAASGASSLLTSSDMASVVTVNEARSRANPPLDKLKKPGTNEDDPDGYLTVTEFKAKRSAKGEATGTASGDAATGQPPNAQPTKSLPSRGAMLDGVMQLLALRDQLIKAEAEQVESRYRDADE